MGFSTITSFIGIGKETTFGTPVAASSYLEINEESVKLAAGQTTKPTLRTASAMRAVKNKKSVEGSFKFPMSYGGAELLLKYCLGANSTSGAGPYTHALTLANALTTPLTIRAKRGDISGNEYVYTGCFIPKMTFSLQPEGQLECTVDILGQDESSVGANSTPTYTTSTYITWDQLTAATVALSTVNIQSFELTIENPFDGDTHKLGSVLRQLPTRGGARKITGKFEFEFESSTHYAFFRNNTENAVAVQFASGGHSLLFALPNVIWQGDTPVVDKVGPFKQVMPFEAKATSDGNELAVTLVNDTSTIA